MRLSVTSALRHIERARAICPVESREEIPLEPAQLLLDLRQRFAASGGQDQRAHSFEQTLQIGAGQVGGRG